MKTRYLGFAAVLSAMTACGDNPTTPDAAPAEEWLAVNIPFAARFGATPFACGAAMPSVGAPAATYVPTDLRFYVSNVQLITADGRAETVELEANAFQGGGVALLDFENGCGTDGTAALHTSITGKVAAGAYRRVAFTLGVPPDKNYLDLAAAAPPLDVTGMYWVWLFGYKYLKLDGTVPVAGGAAAPFFLHLGASGCPGKNFGAPPSAPCAYPNQVRYELAGFDPASSKVVADLAPVLATVNLTVNTPETAPGCMSEPTDPECITVLPRMGVNSAATQQLFKVE